MVISDIQIPGQSFVNKNHHNSRNCNNIDVKIGPVTKLDKRNIGNGFLLVKCDIIVIFPIYCQFGVIQKYSTHNVFFANLHWVNCTQNLLLTNLS